MEKTVHWGNVERPYVDLKEQENNYEHWFRLFPLYLITNTELGTWSLEKSNNEGRRWIVMVINYFMTQTLRVNNVRVKKTKKVWISIFFLKYLMKILCEVFSLKISYTYIHPQLFLLLWYWGRQIYWQKMFTSIDV